MPSTLAITAPSAVAATDRARWGVYAVLTLFAAYYLLPLAIVVSDSFRSLPDHDALLPQLLRQHS